MDNIADQDEFDSVDNIVDEDESDRLIFEVNDEDDEWVKLSEGPNQVMLKNQPMSYGMLEGLAVEAFLLLLSP